MKFSDQDIKTLKSFTGVIGHVIGLFAKSYQEVRTAERCQEYCLALHATNHPGLQSIKLETVINSLEKLQNLFNELCPDESNREALLTRAREIISIKEGMPKFAFPDQTLADGVPALGFILVAIGAVKPDQKDTLLAMQAYSRCLLGEVSAVKLERPWIKNQNTLAPNDAVSRHLCAAQSLQFDADLALLLKKPDVLLAIQTIAYHGYQSLVNEPIMTHFNKVSPVQIQPPIEGELMPLSEAYNVLRQFNALAAAMTERTNNVLELMPGLVNEAGATHSQSVK